MREDRNLSLEQVSEEIAINKSTLSRYERGGSPVPPPMVRSILVAYDITDRDELRRWVKLARDAQEDEWWLIFKDVLPSQHLHYIELESEADSIETFESMLVPALLQTPDYIRQVMQTGANELTDEEIEQRVEARQRRQRRLTDDSRPRFHAIVDENALRRPIDSGLMHEQCAYLLEVADLPGVTLQVLPLSAGLHPGHGQLAILAYDDIEQSFAATETPIGDIVFHKEEEVRAFRDVFVGLTSRSLSTADSAARIEEIGETFG